MMQLRCFDGGDWHLAHGKVGVVVLLDHGIASATDLERLSWGRGWLEFLWLRLWLWGLRHMAVPVVELEIPGEGDGMVGAVRINDV